MGAPSKPSKDVKAKDGPGSRREKKGKDEKKDKKDGKNAGPPAKMPAPLPGDGPGHGDKGLPNCVNVFPEVITYQPENKKQIRNLEVTNKGDRTIMFKMKSTSPGVYRMRPIYFILKPSEAKIVKLSYKGAEQGKPPNLKDRFTVVMTYPPCVEKDIKMLWKTHGERLTAFTHRKYVRIHFDGYDVPPDNKMVPPPPVPIAPAPIPQAAPAPAPAAAPAAPAPAAPAAAPAGGAPGQAGWGQGGIVYVIYQGDQGQGGKSSEAADDKDDKDEEEEEDEEEKK